MPYKVSELKNFMLGCGVMERFEMKKAGLFVSIKCNLKCKLCTAYAPYYKNPVSFSIECLKKIVDEYFKVVDYVNVFTITGGEPMIYKDIAKIISYIATYCDSIGKLEIITNGTVLPDKTTLDVFKSIKNLDVLIDNYGENKSLKAQELALLLKNENVSYRLRNYTSENPHCGGWVDFGNHELKHYSEDDVKAVFKKCAYSGKLGFCNMIFGGKIYLCSKSRRLEELGIKSLREEEYVDFLDATMSVEEKRARIKGFEKLEYLEACAYCNGLCEDSERFIPAEQMKAGEIYEER